LRYCIYHAADLDGKCSGAVTKSYYPDCKMIGIDYNQKLELSQFNKEDEVYMVDFSLPHPQMIELSNRCKLVWIDHHVTSLDIDLSKFNGLALISDQKSAACEITWRYFYGEPLPRAIKLLGRYDVWDHKDPLVLPFQYGMRSFQNNPGDKIWRDVFSDTSIREIVDRGQAILNYIEEENLILCNHTFELEFENLTFIALNNCLGNSKVFDSLADRYHHKMIFRFNGDLWTFSIYSTSVDMSHIAKKYGGGGHAGAAGFSSKIFRLERGKLYVT
jgi:uncharacterized protein